MFAYADSPALKLIGIISEAMGAASLASGMSSFNRECLNELRYDYLEDDDSPNLNPLKRKKSYYPSLKNVKIQIGPGFVAYIVGFIAALIRVLLHFLTPLPHRGKGILLPAYNLIRRILCCGPGCCELFVDERFEEARQGSLRRIEEHETNLSLSVVQDKI
jgi:hypothetical protein